MGGRGAGGQLKFAGATNPQKKRKKEKNGYNARSFPTGEKAMATEYKAPRKLPMTESQKIKELRRMMIEGRGKAVVQKIIDIALEDGHPGQMAALKMCVDRTLPVSMFEKSNGQRSAVTINITGLDGTPLQIGAPSAAEPLTLEMESPTDG
jgi:hypothetical protein